MSVCSRPLHLIIIGAEPKIKKESDCDNQDGHSISNENVLSTKTPNGVQIGPIRIPVANAYGPAKGDAAGVRVRRPVMIHFEEEPDYFFILNNSDVDNEYSYIMNKALRSYKLHRDKERAENRQKLLKTAYRRRWHVPQRPSTPVSADRKGRPKSTLPPKMDAIREVGEANACPTDVKAEDSVDYRKPADVKRVTLSMDTPAIPMSSSYHRRNQQTSHAWYSHSFPSASYLSSHMRMPYSNTSSTSPSPSSSSTSGKSVTNASTKRPYSARTESSKNRPDSAGKYSYDGGIFLPNKPKQDYFVIHPDWVSEAMTIQKLSLNERRPTSGRTGTWPGRRCKSAPPPKFRNPITWDVQIENV